MRQHEIPVIHLVLGEGPNLHHAKSTLATFHLLGIKHPPWLVIGVVLAAALLSRSMMFLIAMLRHRD